MGRLIGRIGNNGLCFRKCLRYLVVHLVKGNAVVDISGRYHRLKHETVLVAGRMGLICKLPLMAALYEQATVRVGHALGDDPCFLFLSSRQFLLGCVISAFFRWIWRLIVVFKRLLPSGFPVCVDFLHQFLRVVLGCCRYRSLYSLFRVGVGLDVSTVNEDGLGRQIACLGYLIQNPRKYPIHGLFGEPMPEVIAHRGKMRRFLLQGITEKPAIAIVCADFFRCPPQRGKAVQMLDQHHLEQHHRVDAGAPIILTIERLHHFIQLCEVHRCIYLSQQMLLRHQLVYDYELYQISIHFPAFQHLSSPFPILPYLSEKAQLQPDFFDRLRKGRISGLSFLSSYSVFWPRRPRRMASRV